MLAQQFNKRIDKEISKFAVKNNISFEDTQDFAEWIVWFSKQQQRNEIISLIQKI